MNLGDSCKWFENNFSLPVAIPKLPVIIRLDGVNFSKWTKGLDKPFDLNLQKLMQELTVYLVKETNATVGYTQSDEITLILYSKIKKSPVYHAGEKDKILSKLASKASVFFNSKRKEYDSLKTKSDAIFDCRIYQVPTLQDAVAQLIWRENDAVKNSIQSVAQSNFEHSSLENLNSNQMQEKLFSEKGINWNDFPSTLKRGSYVKKVEKTHKFTKEELEKLTPKHLAFENPDFEFTRSEIEVIDMPTCNSIGNFVDVIFNNQIPVIKTTL